MRNEKFTGGDEVRLIRPGLPLEECEGWRVVRKISCASGIYYRVQHPMGGVTDVRPHQMEKVPDPTTLRIRAAIDAKRHGIEVHEGPKPGPTCPRCRYDWLLCPCPGDIFFNDLEKAK